MPTVSIRAHFDGERIQLDEPFELPPDVPLLVTVLVTDPDVEREEWSSIGLQAISGCFGDDEPEYAVADVKR